MYLSEVGVLFCCYVLIVLQVFEVGVVVLQFGNYGMLCIGVLLIVVIWVLLQIVLCLCELYFDVMLSVEIGLYFYLMWFLCEGLVDLVIGCLFGLVEIVGMNFEYFYEEEVILVVWVGYFGLGCLMVKVLVEMLVILLLVMVLICFVVDDYLVVNGLFGLCLVIEIVLLVLGCGICFVLDVVWFILCGVVIYEFECGDLVELFMGVCFLLGVVGMM